MKFNLDEEWITRMAELEDNCEVGVGGFLIDQGWKMVDGALVPPEEKNGSKD